MSSGPNDLQPITPAHFLLGKSAKDLPTARQPDDKVISDKLLEGSKRSFWKAWYRDYLVTLQIRKRWLQSGPNFQLGDLVLVPEDNMPPLRWKMDRVEQLDSGNDDINRVAKLRTSSGHIIRRIVKLKASCRFKRRITNQTPYQQQVPYHHIFPRLMSPRSRFFTSRFHASYSKAMKLRVHIPGMILHHFRSLRD